MLNEQTWGVVTAQKSSPAGWKESSLSFHAGGWYNISSNGSYSSRNFEVNMKKWACGVRLPHPPKTICHVGWPCKGRKNSYAWNSACKHCHSTFTPHKLFTKNCKLLDPSLALLHRGWSVTFLKQQHVIFWRRHLMQVDQLTAMTKHHQYLFLFPN